MIDFPGKVSSHAKIDTRNEALYVVVFKFSNDWDNYADCLSVEPPHQEGFSFPFTAGKGCVFCSRAICRVLPAIIIAADAEENRNVCRSRTVGMDDGSRQLLAQ